MNLYVVSYSADFEDSHKKHTHDQMRLYFTVINESREEALFSVVNANPNLDPEKFNVDEEEIIKKGYVRLSSNESFDI
jgi:hypothetical protein